MHRITPEEIGQAVKKARKTLGLRQRDLAFSCGTGIRFIVDLEKGKQTCQLGKVLQILGMLGITVNLELPVISHEQ
ncbi:MAG: transcriptional regulator [Alphaproteobacteria bacterium]|jgi:HTH-type transcriptional regulator / antitoxin HipB|nr:transcriptional regulator [Alphaproteobacteria bacterium]